MKKIILALSTAAAIAGLSSAALAAPAVPATSAASAVTAQAAAPAVDPQTVAAVKSMLEAMEMRKAMVASYAEMEKVMPQMMRSQVLTMIEADKGLNPDQKKQVLANLEKALPSMTGAISAIFRDPAVIDQMMDELVPLYASNFTTAEIKELAAFYRTPLGRKMTATMPKISTQSAQIAQRIVMPRMGKMMQDLMLQLQKQ